jgi:hypothetical protein
VATFFDDCSALTNWTEVGWDGGTSFSVSGGEIVKSTSTADEILVCTLAAAADIEIVFKVRRATITGTYRYIGFVRGASTGAAATLDGYTVGYTTTAIRAGRIDDGVVTTIATQTGKTHTSDIDFWFRLRLNGSDFKVKSWAASGGEPGTWDIETTDATYSASGDVGLRTTPVTAQYYVGDFGIGTSGDTAPMSAAVAGGYGFMRAFPRPILNF